MKEKWQGFCRFVDNLHPVRLVVLGYLAYILFGWVLLTLPLSSGEQPVSSLDALFTSASALSTTGLTTVSTGHGFSLFGQLVILVLIQIGGIGYMTFGSFNETGMCPPAISPLRNLQAVGLFMVFLCIEGPF